MSDVLRILGLLVWLWVVLPPVMFVRVLTAPVLMVNPWRLPAWWLRVCVTLADDNYWLNKDFDQ